MNDIIMDEIIYIDNAATSFPKPDIVHDTIRDFYREKGVNPGRTGCDLAIEAGQMIDGTRKLYSEFFNKSLIDAGTTVGVMLDVNHGIQTRTGLHCAPLIHEHYGTAPRGTVRFSIGPFNTKEHIETAIKAIRKIAQIARCRWGIEL